MYFTKDDIYKLNELIVSMNKFNSDEEKKKFLKENTADSDLLLHVLRNFNKNKLPNQNTKSQSDLYKKEEIYTIFSQHNNEEIKNTYTLQDLQLMYFSIYQRNPIANETKETLINMLRNCIYTLNRAYVSMQFAHNN